MNKFCLKGKIECLHYHEPQKCTALDPHYCETSLVDCEQCPWPSRQVRVEPKPAPMKADKFGKCPIGNFNCENYDLAKHVNSFNAGRSDMKREIGAAVKLLVIPYTPDEFQISTKTAYNEALADTLAAIEGVK